MLPLNFDQNYPKCRILLPLAWPSGACISLVIDLNYKYNSIMNVLIEYIYNTFYAYL